MHVAWRVHRGLYRATGGRLGLRRPKADRYGFMRLTTVGRHSGRDRNVMLAYIDDGDDLVTLAMNGWGAGEPAWWLNLQAESEARVDTADGNRLIVGRAAEGEQRDRLWARWRELDDQLDSYATMRPSETAVVILERGPEPDNV